MSDRLREVYEQLSRVVDPELDEPITELDFVSSVRISGEDVVVEMELPTFWCAANFAFMMAEDVRDRLAELPWVRSVEVYLRGHFFEDEINRAINAGLSFAEAFPDLATDDLAELRAVFRRKAFVARQERLLRWLLTRGWSLDRAVALRLGDLEALRDAEPEARALVERYLDSLRQHGLGGEAEEPAFVTVDGRPLRAEEVRTQWRQAAAVRAAMEFNGSLCRQLLEARRLREHSAVQRGRGGGWSLSVPWKEARSIEGCSAL